MAKVNQLAIIKDHFSKEYMLVEGVGAYKWNGIYWEKQSPNQFKKQILNKIEKIVEEKKITGSLIDSLQKLAELKLTKSSNDLNLNGSSNIVFQNGTFNIDKKVFNENIFFKDDFNTKIMNCNYKQGDLSNWNKYLASTFKDNEDSIELVQEMMGYVLYPGCNYEKSFLFYGQGANGKSVMLNVIQNLVGINNTSYLSMKDLGKSFVRSALLDKSLNISSELRKNVTETEDFKKLVSGESIEGQFKYKDSFFFKNKAKMLFAMNQMAYMNDLSNGLFRRICIIPFINTFNAGNCDPFLLEKLNNEIDAIAFWSIQGLLRLMENNKFTKVSYIDKMSQELKNDNNPVLRFANDCIEITKDEDDILPKIKMYSLYQDWCYTNGNKPLNSNNFYKQFKLDFDLETKKKTVGGKRLNCFTNIKSNVITSETF